MASALEELLAAGDDEWEVDRSPWRDLREGAAPDSPPERVGPYRLLGELGRGGMGRVFLAEEKTADFRRTVALKMIDRPGPDDDSVRRFRDEVRILASLDHPGIARFLAGGRSPEGHWFLALEHVEGEDLLTHSRRRALDARARVELFLAVVDTVQYAHERGVVHRDLKPGHLLVGRDGRPRLLDFGISKLLSPEGEAEATATRTGVRALTPAYASPEQFRGEPASFASDVYSLGVLLYELLAGRRPFGEERSTPLEIERATLTTDPEPPSLAARRAPTAAPVGPIVRPGRDLDAICLKALRKEPGERYASAAALADDLRRFLDGRPVAARRGGLRYRASRFVRRERGRLLVAGALVLALAGFALAWRSSREADRLRPPTPKPFPYANVTTIPLPELEKRFAAAPESLDAGAALALRLVQDDRSEEAELVLARMRQIAGAEHDPLTDYVDGAIGQKLDRPQRALASYTRARDAALAGGRGELVAKIRAARGRVLVMLGQLEEGEQEMTLALADFETAGDTLSAAQVQNNLAIQTLQRGDYARGERELEKAYALFRAAGANGAIVLRNLAELAMRRGRPDVGEKWARESLAVIQVPRRQQGRRIWVLGESLAEQGKTAEALALLDEAIAYSREDRDEPDLASALLVRGGLEVATARFDRIAATVAELEALGRSSGLRATLMAIHLLRGRDAAARGDAALARRELAEGARLQVEEGEPVLAAGTAVERAKLELDEGDPAAAERILSSPDVAPGKGSSVGLLAELLRVRLEALGGRADAARRRLAALGDDADAASTRRRIAFLAARAALAHAEGRDADALADLGAAADAAKTAGWLSEELPLRLDIAALGGATASAERLRIATEAERVGMSGVARRARAAA